MSSQFAGSRKRAKYGFIRLFGYPTFAQTVQNCPMIKDADRYFSTVPSQLRSGDGKFDLFFGESSHLVVVMLVLLSFHSSKKLLHAPLHFVR